MYDSLKDFASDLYDLIEENKENKDKIEALKSILPSMELAKEKLFEKEQHAGANILDMYKSKIEDIISGKYKGRTKVRLVKVEDKE